MKRLKIIGLAVSLVLLALASGCNLPLGPSGEGTDSGTGDGVRAFADGLLRGTLDRLVEIDDELKQQTTHWRLERLAAVDRNILRLAMYELIYESDTPPAVVIDEAIEIAKKYGAKDSGRFVNGVLDGFVKRRAAAG